MKMFTEEAAPALTAIITAAHEAGLLEASLKQAASADAHAAELGLDPRATAMVLDALVAIGALQRDGDRYHAPELELGPFQPWTHLPAFLKTGQPLPVLENRTERGAIYSQVVPALGRRFEAPARSLAKALQPARSILDVGAGSGVWSLAMAAEAPQTRVTGLDLEPVLPCFLATAEAMGLGQRADVLAGDYFTAVPPQAYDRVVLANVLHLEDEAGASEMVRRYAEMLTPGGELVIVDCLGEGTPERELSRALYTVHLALRTAQGTPHRPALLVDWCKRAGLGEVRLIHLDDEAPGAGAVVGQGPS